MPFSVPGQGSHREGDDGDGGIEEVVGGSPPPGRSNRPRRLLKNARTKLADPVLSTLSVNKDLG